MTAFLVVLTMILGFIQTKKLLDESEDSFFFFSICEVKAQTNNEPLGNDYKYDPAKGGYKSSKKGV